jgi:hypothetical protein
MYLWHNIRIYNIPIIIMTMTIFDIISDAILSYKIYKKWGYLKVVKVILI